MNEENVKAWTTALRHTASPQVTGTLVDEVHVVTPDPTGVPTSHAEAGFCCLGLGQKVAGITLHDNGPVEFDDVGNPVEDQDRRFYFAEGCDLPGPTFHRWLGLDVGDYDEVDVAIDWPENTFDRDGDRMDARMSTGGMTCASLNDTAKLTFPQIADVIDYFGIKAPPE